MTRTNKAKVKDSVTTNNKSAEGEVEKVALIMRNAFHHYSRDVGLIEAWECLANDVLDWMKQERQRERFRIAEEIRRLLFYNDCSACRKWMLAVVEEIKTSPSAVSPEEIQNPSGEPPHD